MRSNEVANGISTRELDLRKRESTEQVSGSSQIQRAISRILGALIAAAALIGGYWTIRVAWADWIFLQDYPQSVPRAVSLVPTNPGYYRDLAQVDHTHAVPLLEQAARLDPDNSSIYIELGLAAEA